MNILTSASVLLFVMYHIYSGLISNFSGCNNSNKIIILNINYLYVEILNLVCMYIVNIHTNCEQDIVCMSAFTKHSDRVKY
jgi:hypothetical protein